MNSKRLQLEDGTPLDLWICDCGTLYRQPHLADMCCEQKFCDCGAPRDEVYYTHCAACREVERLERLSKVEEVPAGHRAGATQPLRRRTMRDRPNSPVDLHVRIIDQGAMQHTGELVPRGVRIELTPEQRKALSFDVRWEDITSATFEYEPDES